MFGLALLALAPAVILIALGYVFKRIGLVADTFWPQAERLAYYVLLPALFVHGLATADLGALPIGPLATVLICATSVAAALVLACRPLAGGDGASFTSIFQGSIRFNNYIGVTAAAGLFGHEGVALAAICNAAIVPTVNLLCILVFARYGSARFRGREVVRQIAANPLILACAAGIALRAPGLGIPAGIEPALKQLGAAALPLGLLCVGAALEFGAARSWARPLLFSSTAKFLVVPAVTFAAARLAGLSGNALTVALLFQSLPTASSAYILARQLGGNAPLMAGIMAVQTVLAGLTLPAVLAAAGNWF